MGFVCVSVVSQKLDLRAFVVIIQKMLTGRAKEFLYPVSIFELRLDCMLTIEADKLRA